MKYTYLVTEKYRSSSFNYFNCFNCFRHPVTIATKGENSSNYDLIGGNYDFFGVKYDLFRAKYDFSGEYPILINTFTANSIISRVVVILTLSIYNLTMTYLGQTMTFLGNR